MKHRLPTTSGRVSQSETPYFVIWVVRVAFMLLTGCFLQAPLAAQETSEYQVEAAFLYHFAKFVEWPSQAFAETNSPITIGILGEDPFGDALESTIHNKTVDNRTFRIVHLDIKSLADARQCQILFIGPSERRRVGQILDSLKNTSVLTVSKMDRFIEVGGMINFFIEDKKVRFEINNDQARLAGLKISAKLLNLARHKEGG